DRNLCRLDAFRRRFIFDLSSDDKLDIYQIFLDFYYALEIDFIKFSDEYSQKGRMKKYSVEALISLLDELDFGYKGRKDLRAIFDFLCTIEDIRPGIDFIDKKNSDSKKNYIVFTISKLRSKIRRKFNSGNLVKRSPVSVSKCLHLLAPNFFPLWDRKIAQEYKCGYVKRPNEQYYFFCEKAKHISAIIKDYKECKRSGKSILKLLDEYNYAKYTKGWID
ncbi:unnamed protein product, partial [marine sediment metagenome]